MVVGSSPAGPEAFANAPAEAAPAPAPGTLEAGIDRLTTDILKATGGSPPEIGRFTGVGVARDSNYGAAVEAALSDALPRPGGGRATFSVTGNYALVTREPSDAPGGKSRRAFEVLVRVVTLATNRTENEFSVRTVEEFPVEIDDPPQVAAALGVTGEIARREPDGAPKPREELLEQIATLNEKPAADAAGTGTLALREGADGVTLTRVAPAAGSPYSVEVVAGPTLEALDPVPVFGRNGNAHVSLQTGDLCELRIYNSSAGLIAVDGSVDGLNTFHFSEAPPAPGQSSLPYLVEAAMDDAPGVGAIPGWFRRPTGPGNYFAFRVGAYGGGNAPGDLQPDPQAIGAFHLAFSTATRLEADGGARGDDARQAIEQGPARDVDLTFLPCVIDEPTAFVTIRYDRPKSSTQKK